MSLRDLWRRFWDWLRGLFGGSDDTSKPKPVTNFNLEIEMANARLSWTWPTQRELGEALALNEIKHLEINMSADGGANFSGLAQVPPVVGSPTAEHLVADLNPGTYIFRAVVVDIDDRRSGVAEAGDSILSPPEALADFAVTIE